MPLHEASISALTARRTGAYGVRPSALGCERKDAGRCNFRRKPISASRTGARSFNIE